VRKRVRPRVPRLDQLDAVALELELLWGRRDVRELIATRMDIGPKARRSELLGDRHSAHHPVLLHNQYIQSGHRQITGTGQTVMSTADHNRVRRLRHRPPSVRSASTPSSRGLRNAVPTVVPHEVWHRKAGESRPATASALTAIQRWLELCRS